MDDWEKLNETSLSEKEDFYIYLNMEDITDEDYPHSKRVFKNFEIKRIRGISWFVCSKLYIIVNWCIWTWSWISTTNSFINTKVKLHLLTDSDILSMVEKSIRGGICYSIYWYAKANNKCMKDYHKNKESPYL